MYDYWILKMQYKRSQIKLEFFMKLSYSFLQLSNNRFLMVKYP